MIDMNLTLEVRGLFKTFVTSGLGGRVEVHAVRGVDLKLRPGETTGLVGESGWGKSTLARCAVHLLEPDAGSVFFEGTDLSRMSASDLRKSRRHFQMIFQDPLASLNPRLPVAEAIAEPLEAHRLGTRRERDLQVAQLMGIKMARLTGIHPERLSIVMGDTGILQRMILRSESCHITSPRKQVHDILLTGS